MANRNLKQPLEKEKVAINATMYHNSPHSVKQNETTEQECQLMTARANQTTGLTNVYSPFSAVFRHQLTFLFRC